MVGTVVGAVAIIILTASFAQNRVGFLLGLAAWGAVCCCVATILRNFAAYAAALAGYTAAILASDVLGSDGGANGEIFMLGVTRALEICIGIVSAGIVLALTDLGGARRLLANEFVALSIDISSQGAAGGALAADRVSTQVAMNGVSHTIEAVATGGTVSLFMASRRAPLHDKLAHAAATWSAATDAEIRSNGQALAARLATVRKREDTLIAAYAAQADNKQRHALAEAAVNEIGAALAAIAGEFGITLEDEEVPRATSFQASALNQGRATRAYVDPLTVESLRPRQAELQFAPGGFLGFPGRSSYAAGHLVADTFGGSNEPANLALMSRGTNGRFSSIEAKVRNALHGTKKIPEPRTVLRYEVSVQFEDNPAEQLEG
jgi:uncharacterized membrane protein YccC